MIKQQYAIVGLGRFCSSLTQALLDSGNEVLAIVISEDRVNEFADTET